MRAYARTREARRFLNCTRTELALLPLVQLRSVLAEVFDQRNVFAVYSATGTDLSTANVGLSLYLEPTFALVW